ncbi:MAG: PAS domain S-box protein [Chloroflexi bacterium]|nr:PAS domain S-box protein [Chloroflexota bacterium]
MGALVVVPIVSRRGPLGVIEVYSPATASFDEHGASLLQALASTAATTLDNADLYRQREADVARLQTIIEQLPVALLVVDAASRAVVAKNRQAELLFGDALDGLRAGLSDDRVARHPDGRLFDPAEWPLARALETGEVTSSEVIQIQRPDGVEAFVSVNAAPVHGSDGDIVAAVAVIDDVSGDEELRRQKNQFLAAAAHDLKTPITSIRGLVQLLRRQLGRLDLPEDEMRLQHTLTGIESGTRKMTGLIDELLDISRLDIVGELSLSRRQVDIVQIARSVIDAVASNLSSHQVMLSGEEGPIVGYWDESRIDRAISNLVGNAVKYSPQGGKVEVNISTIDEGGSAYVVLSVTDQGIGIPAADQQRIFDRFQRGSNLQERVPGSGIGLSYVREIVQEHGGQVSVQSRPGEGSTFTIRLPRDAQ